jgi:hypothetical protein
METNTSGFEWFTPIRKPQQRSQVEVGCKGSLDDQGDLTQTKGQEISFVVVYSYQLGTLKEGSLSQMACPLKIRHITVWRPAS